MFEFTISCLILGIVVGFLSSLFGIGGGTVIVPVLLYLYYKIGFAVDYSMPMALGTSFAIIIITSLSSSYQHYKLKNINFDAIRTFIIPLIMSVLITSLFVDYFNQTILKIVFCCLLLTMSLKMLIPSKINEVRDLSFTTRKNIICAIIIGTISSLAGLGGGAFMVPYFNANGLKIQQAIGTSSFCGIFLSVMGTIGFILSGLKRSDLPSYSAGYIYLPAVMLISITILISSKFGATLATNLPTKTLKKIFAIFLTTISIYMLVTTFHK